MPQTKTLNGIEGLGTHWYFEFFEEVNLEELEKIIKKEIEIFEKSYSRFDENSKLSLLNKNRFFENPSQEFLELIQIGLKFYNESNGIFNFGLGKILEETGYDKNYSFEEKQETSKIPNLEETINFDSKKIELNGDFNLDFGGFGKGFFIDKLAKVFKENGLKYFLINGGGDIFVTSQNGEEVNLFLQNPLKDDEYIFEIKIKNSSLCSSSAFKRAWTTKNTNKNFSHVIDTKSKKSFQSSIYNLQSERNNLGQTNLQTENNLSQEKELVSTFCVSPETLISDIFCTIGMMEYGEKNFEQLCEKYEVSFLGVNSDLEIVGENNFRKLII